MCLVCLPFPPQGAVNTTILVTRERSKCQGVILVSWISASPFLSPFSSNAVLPQGRKDVQLGGSKLRVEITGGFSSDAVFFPSDPIRSDTNN